MTPPKAPEVSGAIVTIVVAMDEQGVIGKGGRLPWHIPDDLRRFKSITMGKPIVMGRRTHESIGRPLPGRRNIVITSRADYAAPGCEIASTFAAALALAGAVSEVMIIGGAAVYREALPQAGRMYMTRVHACFDGDVFFPAFEEREWREIAREPGETSASPRHTFFVLDRIGQATALVRPA